MFKEVKKQLLLAYTAVTLMLVGVEVVAGERYTKTLELDGIAQLTVNGDSTATVSFGDKAMVTATGTAKALQGLQAYVDEGELVLGIKPVKKSWLDNEVVHFDVQLTRLDRLSVGDKAKVHLKNYVGTELDVDAKGASQLQLPDLTLQEFGFQASGVAKVVLKTLTVEDSFFTLSGASEVHILGTAAETVEAKLSGTGALKIGAGKAQLLIAALSGASRIDAPDVQFEQSDLALHGAAKAKLHVDNQLTVEAHGAASVEYSGDPSVEADTAAAANVTKVGV